MIKTQTTFLTLFLFMLVSSLSAQIVINEIDPASDKIELKNIGESPVDVSGYFFCNWPAYKALGSLTASSSKIIPAGGIVVFDATADFIDTADGELGLYTTNDYINFIALADYVEWGSTGHKRSKVGVNAGKWTTGDFVPALATGESIEYDGDGITDSDYAVVTSTTLGEENSIVLSTSLDFNLSEEISVSPNPATNILNINNVEVKMLKVYSATGAEMLSINNQGFVEVGELASGVYFVEVVYGDNQQFTTRFIKH